MSNAIKLLSELTNIVNPIGDVNNISLSVMKMPSKTYVLKPNTSIERPNPSSFGNNGGILFIPDSYFDQSNKNKTYPLIVGFHGSGFTIGSGNYASDLLHPYLQHYMGLSNVGTTHDFLLYLHLGSVGFSSSDISKGSFQHSALVSSNTTLPSVQDGFPCASDAKFVLKQIENIVESYRVNKKYIFAYGSSAGSILLLQQGQFFNKVFSGMVHYGAPAIKTKDLIVQPFDENYPVHNLIYLADGDQFFSLNPAPSSLFENLNTTIKHSKHPKYSQTLSNWTYDTFGPINDPAGIPVVQHEGKNIVGRSGMIGRTNLTVWIEQNGTHSNYGATTNSWFTNVFNWMMAHPKVGDVSFSSIDTLRDIYPSEIIDFVQRTSYSQYARTLSNVSANLTGKSWNVYVNQVDDIEDRNSDYFYTGVVPPLRLEFMCGNATISIASYDDSSKSGTLTMTYTNSRFSGYDAIHGALAGVSIFSDAELKSRIDNSVQTMTFNLIDNIIITSSYGFTEILNPSGTGPDATSKFPDQKYAGDAFGLYGAYGYPTYGAGLKLYLDTDFSIIPLSGLVLDGGYYRTPDERWGVFQN